EGAAFHAFLRGERDGRNGGIAGDVQRAGIGLVGEHADDAVPRGGRTAGFQQCAKIAAATGSQYRDAQHQPIRTRSLPLAGTISPITRLRKPFVSSMSIIAAASCLAATMTKPMPQLKVRHISASVMLPSRCSQSNTAGNAHVLASTAMPRCSGTTRTMFSLRP